MKTVGNDLVRHQLHENRKWYLGLGILLVLFGFVLLAALPFATLSDAEVAAIEWIAIVINTWNRIAISSQYAVNP